MPSTSTPIGNTPTVDATAVVLEAPVRRDRAAAPELDRCRAQRFGIAVRLHADQVIRQQRLHELRVDRQSPQRLDVRERHVQEEPDRARDAELAQAGAERDQLVVVHPDDVVLLQQWSQALGEPAVDGQVGIELLVAVAEGVEEVMTERPQRAVAETAVEERELVRLQVECGVLDVAAARERRLRRGRVGGRLATPAEPQPPRACIACRMPTARPPTAMPLRGDATRFDTLTSRLTALRPSRGSGARRN
jgi:hypothetical protein